MKSTKFKVFYPPRVLYKNLRAGCLFASVQKQVWPGLNWQVIPARLAQILLLQTFQTLSYRNLYNVQNSVHVAMYNVQYTVIKYNGLF